MKAEGPHSLGAGGEGTIQLRDPTTGYFILFVAQRWLSGMHGLHNAKGAFQARTPSA